MRKTTLLVLQLCLAVAEPALAREETDSVVVALDKEGANIGQPSSKAQTLRQATGVRVGDDLPSPLKKAPAVLTDHFGDPLPKGAIARLGALRFRHDGLTLGLTYTRDGKYVVGSSFSGAIVWDAKSGRERLRISDVLPLKMAASPDGTTLAIYGRLPTSTERTIKFWDLRTGKHLPSLTLPKNKEKNLSIGQLSFSPDSTRLVVNTVDDGKAGVFDLNSGQVSFFGGEGSFFYSLAVSPDSKTVAVAVRVVDPAALNAGCSVQLWDLVTGKPARVIHSVPPNKAEGYAKVLTFSPDGKVLAFGTTDRAFLFNPVTGQELGQIEIKLGQDYELGLAPDAKKLVACDVREWKVRVLDIAKGKILHTFEAHRGTYRPSCSMALSPDGKTVALGTVWNALQFWDVATGKELFTEYQGHFSQINGLAFSRDSKVLASCGGNGPILLWDTATGRRSGTVPGEALAVAFSPLGDHLASGSAGTANGTEVAVRIWDVAARRDTMVAKVRDAWFTTTVAFSADGRQLFSLSWDDQGQNKFSVRRWDTATGKQETLWTTSGLFGTLYFAPDAKRVFHSSYANEIGIFDIESGREHRLHAPDKDRVSCLSSSADARVLASATLDPIGHVRLWEIATGKEAFLLKGHSGNVAALAWSRDGRLVASGDQRPNQFEPTTTQTVRVWDAYSGQQMAAFGGFNAGVWALAFSPDGKFLAAGLQDSTILVWDVDQLDKPQPAQLTNEELDLRWADLAGEDAGKAHRAIGTLVLAPKQSAPFLRDHLKPVAVADQAKILQWIAELDSGKFQLRQAAGKELEKIGAQVQVPIRKALTGNTTLETRRRLEHVLNAVLDVPGRETVRVLRAIMVLERIASPEAQGVLETLARGAPGARETEDAQATRERLKLRAAIVR